MNVFKIAKLELQPGDSLVVKCDIVLSGDQVAHIRENFKRYVPADCEVIVLGGGLSLEVLKQKPGNYIPQTSERSPPGPPPKPRK